VPGQNLTRAEASRRAELVDVHGYRIALDLTGEGETFGSVTTVTFTAAPGASTFIDLIAPAVDRVVLNGA